MDASVEVLMWPAGGCCHSRFDNWNSNEEEEEEEKEKQASSYTTRRRPADRCHVANVGCWWDWNLLGQLDCVLLCMQADSLFGFSPPKLFKARLQISSSTMHRNE